MLKSSCKSMPHDQAADEIAAGLSWQNENGNDK